MISPEIQHCKYLNNMCMWTNVCMLQVQDRHKGLLVEQGEGKSLGMETKHHMTSLWMISLKSEKDLSSEGFLLKNLETYSNDFRRPSLRPSDIQRPTR